MASLVNGTLCTAGIAAAAYTTRAAYAAFNAYTSPENYEDSYFNKTLTAMNYCIKMNPVFEKTLNNFNKPNFFEVKNVIEVLRQNGTSLDENAANKFTTALERYRTNLDQFQEYSGTSSEENLKNVKQELSDANADNTKLTTRALHFESCLISNSLSINDGSETNAYAKVLDAREKLSCAIKITDSPYAKVD